MNFNLRFRAPLLVVTAGLLTLIAGCRDDGWATSTSTAAATDAVPAAAGTPRFLGTMLLPLGDDHGVSAKAGAMPALTGNGIDIQRVSTSYVDFGTINTATGVRYLSITYKVRNAYNCTTPGSCTPYNSVRTNLTLMPVARSNTLAGTPFSALTQNGVATSFDPTLLVPVQGTQGSDGVTMGPSSGTPTTAAGKDSLQLFSEDEVAAFPGVGTGSTVFDYGFVVRNVNSTTSRTLPVTTGNGNYDGLVTVAYRMPLRDDTPTNVSLYVATYDDTNTRVSQSTEEASAAGDLVGAARASALGSIDLVTPGARLIASNIGDPVCRLRTAGGGKTGMAPTYLTNDSFTAGAVFTSPNLLTLSPTSALRLGFCQPMAAPTAATLVVSGSISGPRVASGSGLRTASFTGGGSNRLVATPTSGQPFLPGETVTYTLATGQKTSANASTVGGFTGTYIVGGLTPSTGAVGLNTTQYQTGTTPFTAINADLNGDGALDVVTPNFGDSTVSVLLGNTGAGVGTLRNQVTYDVGLGPSSVTAADLDGDGVLDLVTTNRFAKTVSVLIANTTTVNSTVVGTGTFKAAVDYPVGRQPQSLVVGNFTRGDSVPDLAVANNADGTITVLAGGSGGLMQPARGTFGTTTGTYSTIVANSGDVASPYSLVTGDFNGDTLLDIAVTNSRSNDVSILPGNAATTFGTVVSYVTGTNPYMITSGDFDGDGKADLAVANNGSATISVLINTSTTVTPTFAAPVSYAVGSFPTAISNADLDGDGILDLAVTNSGSNSVSVLTGMGAGNRGKFNAKTDYGISGAGYGLSIGDINKDGSLDLVVPSLNTKTVVLLYGRTAPQQGQFGDVTSTTPQGVVAGDFNGDGVPDVAIANGAANSLSVLLGNTATAKRGTFTTKVDYTTGATPSGIVTADFNGDGVLDLATANKAASGTVSVLLGSTSTRGTFGIKTDFAVGSMPNALIAGDFNNDGITDLATANLGSATVSVLLGSATARGSFAAATTSGSTGSAPTALTTGDFNGDGLLDLATANPAANTLAVLLNSAAAPGAFTIAGATYSVGSTPNSIVTGDVDGDGVLDLVTTNGGDSTVSVLLGNKAARGSFDAAIAYGTTGNDGNGTPLVGTPTALGIGDVNGDGVLDLSVANNDTSDIAVLLGSATNRGAFTRKGNYPILGQQPVGAVLVDTNGDNKLDVVNASKTLAVLSVLLGS